MPSAQDHAFAHLIAARGAVSPDALARAAAELERRPGHTLAQALLERRLLAPAHVAEALRELARSSFVCQPCHDLRSYDALAALPTLRCPSCGGPLAIVPVTGRDSRLTHTTADLGDTAVGPPAAAPPPPFARPARPSGTFITPARPSGLHAALPAGPRAPSGVHALPSGVHALPSGVHALPSGVHPLPSGVHTLPAANAAQVGPYTVVRELGRGSNGVVYLARRPGLERNFAVKVLLHGDLDPDGAARFEREASIASKIGDAGVIGVFDVGRHGGQPYYAMEYCPGATLEQRLRHGPLPPDDAARLVEQLARTVHAAHGHAVIHRDLKPANVILEDGTGRPKILDFGLARDRTRVDSLTRTGEVLGTPYYMAPEQIRGDRDIDHRIDVYALGVILYECLTGRRPFEAASVLDLAQKIRGEEPPAPRAVKPDVPAALEAACLRAMSKRPEARHPTARHLADELAAAHRPATPDPGLGESSQAVPGARPSRAAAAVLVVAAAAAAGALGLALARGPRPFDPAPGGADDEVAAAPHEERAARVAASLERARALAAQRASDEPVLAELDRTETLAAGDPALRAAARLERAAFLSRRSRHRAAEALAGELLDVPAARAEAMRIVALAHERQERDVEARAWWTRLAEEAPDAPQGLTAAAAAARLARDRARALDLAERAAREAPAFPPALLERAVLRAVNGRPADALASARAALEVWPDDALSHLVVGYTSMHEGDARGARAAFDEAVRLGEPDPEPPALLGRARLSLEERRLDHALADVERVLDRRPGDIEGLVLRGVVLHLLGGSDARRAGAEDAWRQAHDARPDEFLAVVEDLPAAVQQAAREAAGVPPAVVRGERPPVPMTPAVRARLERWVQPLEPGARRLALHALLAAAEGRPLSHVEPRLRAAVALDPRSERLAYLGARLLAGRDAYEAALAELERARGLGAPAGELDLLRGEVLWFQGLGHEAAPLWDALAYREPASAAGLCAAAWAHYARNDGRAAIAAATEAVRRGPELASALVVLGLAQRQEDRHTDARAAFQQALALEGALLGRVAVFELDSALEPAIQAHGWGREPSAELDEGMARLEALFEIGGATSRLVAVQNALLLGPRSRWFERCDRWLDEAKLAEPRRGELDMWHGWVTLNRPSGRADDVLAHWRRARVKEPKIVLSKGMRDAFKQRFGDHPALAEFPER